MWYEDVSESKELLDVLRAKVVYERMIREKAGVRRTFSIAKEGKVGAVQYAQFAKITKTCKQLGVRIEDYFAVMFALPPRLAQKWPYPYLGFVASNKAFEIYRDRKRFLGRVFPSVFSAVKAINPLNYENRFTNCFYNGFMVLHSAVEREGLREVGDPVFLFPLFIAFGDIYTSEFVVTHSQFQQYKDAELPIEEMEMKTTVVGYGFSVWKRMQTEKRYRMGLLTSRKEVAEREKIAVKRIYEYLTDWKEIWELLS